MEFICIKMTPHVLNLQISKMSIWIKSNKSVLVICSGKTFIQFLKIMFPRFIFMIIKQKNNQRMLFEWFFLLHEFFLNKHSLLIPG